MIFAESTVLITGGAQGIGLATAQRFLQEGARVAIWALHPESLVAARATLGSSVLTMVTDVGDPDAVDRSHRILEASLGPIDILVNNAGYTLTTPFLQEDRVYWERIVRTNLWGVVFTCHALLPSMVVRKQGVVVNVVSDAGRVGMAGEAVYAASKGGVVALTKSLAQEMARYHIRLNCVSPGPTRTRILEDNAREAQPLIDKMVRRIPLGEIAEPDDIAQAILFLAGPGAHHITGQVLSVSGGLTMV